MDAYSNRFSTLLGSTSVAAPVVGSDSSVTARVPFAS